jgi:hypothetical protein
VSAAARALVVQPDGKLVAAGWSSPSGTSDPSDFALVRYLSFRLVLPLVAGDVRRG